MSLEPEMLYNLPRTIASALGPVFWLLLALGLGYLYVKKKGTQTSLQTFASTDFSLRSIIRVSRRLVFSRRWIVGIPFVLALISIIERELTQIIVFHTYFKESMYNICETTASEMYAFTLRNYFVLDLKGLYYHTIEFLHQALFLWDIKLSPYFSIVAFPPLLVLMAIVIKRNDYFNEILNKHRRLVGILIVLIVLMAIHTILLSEALRSEELSENILYIIISSSALGVMLLIIVPGYFSIWFSAIFKTADEWYEHVFPKKAIYLETQLSFVLKKISKLYLPILLILIIISLYQIGWSLKLPGQR